MQAGNVAVDVREPPSSVMLFVIVKVPVGSETEDLHDGSLVIIRHQLAASVQGHSNLRNLSCLRDHASVPCRDSFCRKIVTAGERRSSMEGRLRPRLLRTMGSSTAQLCCRELQHKASAKTVG